MLKKLNYSNSELLSILGSFTVLIGVFLPWFYISYPFSPPGQIEQMVGQVYGYHIFVGRVMLALTILLLALAVFRRDAYVSETFMFRLVSAGLLVFLYLVNVVSPVVLYPSRMYLQLQVGAPCILVGCIVIVYGLARVYGEIPS